MNLEKSKIKFQELETEASFKIYQTKVKATEEELEKIEIEKDDIWKEISKSETGIATKEQSLKLDELINREGNLHSLWNEYEMTYQVGSLSEYIQNIEPAPKNDDWFRSEEMSEEEIQKALEELDQLREDELSNEEELDLSDF